MGRKETVSTFVIFRGALWSSGLSLARHSGGPSFERSPYEASNFANVMKI